MKLRIVTNSDKTVVYFSDIPDEDSRSEIKSKGFRWEPRSKYWYSKKADAVETLRAVFKDAEISEVNTDSPQDGENKILSELLDAMKEYRALQERMASISEIIEDTNLPLSFYLSDKNILSSAKTIRDFNKFLDDAVDRLRELVNPSVTTADNVKAYEREYSDKLTLSLTYREDKDGKPYFDAFTSSSEFLQLRDYVEKAGYGVMERHNYDGDVFVNLFRSICRVLDCPAKRVTGTLEDGKVVVSWETNKTITYKEFKETWANRFYLVPSHELLGVTKTRLVWRVLNALCRNDSIWHYRDQLAKVAEKETEDA